MSRLEKVIRKLINLNAVFTYNDLIYLLNQFGYNTKKTGKTSGSRVAFINPETMHIIRIHKPHPGNEIKRYVRVFIINELRKEGYL